jgi:hypothetical protein
VDVSWVPEDPSTPEHMHYPLPPSLWGLTFDAKICLGNLSTCFVYELDAPADCTPSSGKSGFTHMMFCDQGNIPTACITYWPQVPQVLSIDVNGAPVPCVKIGDLPPNDTNIHCALDQSLQGTNVTASVCPGGVCQDAMVDVPVCGQQQTPDCICRVTAPDCLTTTAMGFNVDTCVKNPVALVPGSVTANDGTNSYDCVVTGGVGSAYCGGSIPSSSGPLTVCFTQEGSSDQKCCYFENFGNSIPNCSSYNPNPGGPQVNCSLFSTQASCQSNGCTWIPGSVKPGYCQ